MRSLRPSPALVVALVAVLFSATGGAYAASKITGSQIARNAITGKHVKNRSLSPADFRGSVRGPQGPPGLQGAPGPQGPAGVANVTAVDGPAGFQCANGGGGCQVASSTATCPAGTVAVGGGFNADTPDNVVGYAKRGPNSYAVIATNFWSTSGSVTAQVICASGPGVTAARAKTSALTREVAARVERLRAQLGG